MGNGVLDIDHGWKRIRKDLAAAQGAYTKVGIQQDTRREDASPMVVIAAAHEFGTENQRPPKRSWLRVTYDQNREKIAQLMRVELDQILQGKRTAEQSLALVGEWFQTKIKTRIRGGITPGLSEATKKNRQGPDASHVGPRVMVPLIDTAQFIESIRYLVVPGTRKKVKGA